MTEIEQDDFIKTIFPIGEERWVKVKYLDLQKCIKTFYVGPNNKKSEEISEKLGFETTAIGLRPEYEPQISAILDLKEDVVGYMSLFLDEYQLENLNKMFKSKMDEMKERLIKEK